MPSQRAQNSPFALPLLRSEAGEPARLGRFVACSRAMREVLAQIAALAASDLPVLIEGGPGSGKSLAARTLCDLGAWDALPRLELDASVPAARFDEGLARVREAAYRGRSTLILESIEILSTDRQRAVVRLLDELAVGEGMRLRLVTTSRRELHAEVVRGRFRADLYYRLRGALLRIPSLAERPDDLPILIDDLAKELGQRSGRGSVEITREARVALLGHPWSGNVRELSERLEEAALQAQGGRIDAADLTLPAAGVGPAPEGASDLKEYRRRQERALVLEALESVRWNVSAAARGLGISRVGLSKKMKVLGLMRPASGE